MSLKASPKYSSPKQPAKGEELNMLSGSHHSMGLEELHGSYLLDNWGIIELNMLGEPHLGRELPLQSCIITNVLALEKLDKICPLDTGILGILAELKSDPLDERRVTVDNRTVRSITPRARSRVQFGSLPRRSGLLKRMRSLGLKDSFVLSAVFFGSTVLADDPGGVGSGCNDRGHSATTASRILGYAYPFLVAGVAFFIRAKAQRAGGRQGRQEESLFYLVQVGISGIVYLQGLDSDNTTFLEMATNTCLVIWSLFQYYIDRRENGRICLIAEVAFTVISACLLTMLGFDFFKTLPLASCIVTFSWGWLAKEWRVLNESSTGPLLP